MGDLRIVVCLLSAAWAALGAAPREIVLRPDLPAGEEWYVPEGNIHLKTPSEKWVRKVMRPVVEVYPAATPNGTGVIIAPGGGFAFLAIGYEGRDVARWMNERGVTAFVLRYRVGLENREASRKAAVEDVLLAVKTVRRRAAEWKLDPERIGVLGFSAGGYLTVAAATVYDPESRPGVPRPRGRAAHVHRHCGRRHGGESGRFSGAVERMAAGEPAGGTARVRRRRARLRHG
jgi:acetyl esterase/lipase